MQRIHFSLIEEEKTRLKSQVEDLSAQEESYCWKMRSSDLGIKINMKITFTKYSQYFIDF